MKSDLRIHRKLVSALCAASLALSAFAAVPLTTAPAHAAPEPAPAPTTVEVTTWQGVQDALKQNNTIAKLTKDITAPDGTSAPLTVTGNVTVTLDLNGHILDRGLKGKTAVKDGSVLLIQQTDSEQTALTLQDSSQARRTQTLHCPKAVY